MLEYGAIKNYFLNNIVVKLMRNDFFSLEVILVILLFNNRMLSCGHYF